MEFLSVAPTSGSKDKAPIRTTRPGRPKVSGGQADSDSPGGMHPRGIESSGSARDRAVPLTSEEKVTL